MSLTELELTHIQLAYSLKSDITHNIENTHDIQKKIKIEMSIKIKEGDLFIITRDKKPNDVNVNT